MSEYWLTKHRKQKKLTLEEFGKAVGKRKTTIANWERIERIPIQIEIVNDISKTLDIPINSILMNEGFDIELNFGEHKVDKYSKSVLDIMLSLETEEKKILMKTFVEIALEAFEKGMKINMDKE